VSACLLFPSGKALITGRCGYATCGLPLCRNQYLGDDENWGFAVYDPATQTYANAILRTGERTGHPNDAFDTAVIIHPPTTSSEHQAPRQPLTDFCGTALVAQQLPAQPAGTR
jgi:hypothetical protein